VHSRSRFASFIASLTSLLLVAVLAFPAGAAEEVDEAAKSSKSDSTLSIYHGAVDTTLADAASDGHQLGDLRVASIVTTDADGEPWGRLDATLTTTAVDVPAVGNEIRISMLVFSFGEAGNDQVVVGGSALYPAEGPTIAIGAVATRPILGGSGKFAGAAGSALTEHLDDDTWVHTLALDDFKKAKPGVARVKTEASSDGEEVGITRIDLGIAQPGTAPGESLGLFQYHIPAGSELVPHTHPGWQVARIVKGELEYTIIAGEGTIIHKDGSREPIGPGSHILREGDSVVENPALEHFGANRTRKDVIILAATLFTEGAPLSTPIEMPAADEAPAGEPVVESSPAA
jgi:quercetin dioxygenase-like cupin family protein